MTRRRNRFEKEAAHAKDIPCDLVRLAREASKLDSTEEQAIADEGLARDFEEWPDY